MPSVSGTSVVGQNIPLHSANLNTTWFMIIQIRTGNGQIAGQSDIQYTLDRIDA
jgi:hypothetical protein